MKKRIDKKVTVKQAKITAFMISVFLFILVGVFIGIVISEKNIEGINIFAIIFLGGVAIMFMILVLEWEKLQLITELVINVEEKKEILDFLNKDAFTELSFIPENDNNGSEYEMLVTIITKMECRVFAKLEEDEKIILIIKDKEENEIYSCEISSDSYFNARFKLKVK